MGLFLLTLTIVLIVGALLALYAHYSNLCSSIDGQSFRITLLEFVVVGAAIVGIAWLVMIIIGPHMARESAVNGYKEFWNGAVIHAGIQEIPCTRDGPCVHEYDCDPYNHLHETRHHDSKGNYTHSTWDNHTHYHSCPYATHEYTYFLNDSLGRTVTIASHIFADNPQEWRGGSGIPGRVARGVPERWLISKQRLEAGDAEPVTKLNEYANFILASENQVLRAYSASIDRYVEAGLMPPHTVNLGKEGMMYDFDMQASKIHFIGVNAEDEAVWHDRLMRFNAALGSERQGDLHIVVLPAAQVPNPDDYANALRAYWLNEFGKWGFPKNGIALVLGVSNDGQTIEWARARTGMPEGNGGMMDSISRRLPGMPFNADAVLGKITSSPKTDEEGELEPVFNHGNGILDRIMFVDFPFQRPCMKSCDDEGDSGSGYVFLGDQIPVTTGAKVLMFVIVTILSFICWAVALFCNPFGSNHSKLPPPSRPRSMYTQARKGW